VFAVLEAPKDEVAPKAEVALVVGAPNIEAVVVAAPNAEVVAAPNEVVIAPNTEVAAGAPNKLVEAGAPNIEAVVVGGAPNKEEVVVGVPKVLVTAVDPKTDAVEAPKG